MKPPFAPLILLLLALRSTVAAERPKLDQEASKAAVVEKIRDRIIWYDAERTRLHLIPEDVIGLLPPDEMPIPKDDQEALSAAIQLLRDWRSPAGMPYPSCTYPQFYDHGIVPEESKSSIESVVAEGPVSLLVNIDRVTKVWWPDDGVYQYNEVSIVKVVTGENFRGVDPLSTRVFLTAGGEMVVEGARFCTLAPWHAEPPHTGEQFLLVGAPDDRGVFHANYYFQVDSGLVVWANYSSLRKPSIPLTLGSILEKRAAGSRATLAAR